MRRRSGKTNSEKRKQSSAMATVWRIPEAYFFSQGIYDNIQVAGVHFAGIHKGFLDSCCKCACGVGFRTLSTPDNVHFRRNGRCGRLLDSLMTKLAHVQCQTQLLGFATEYCYQCEFLISYDLKNEICRTLEQHLIIICLVILSLTVE
ncbi:Hypothetical_protein [Hexamita inflata]|uniref:Hypothetical_protein n=1 Tax=Hexamita inflata TaxID=28002 RepID=A0AA86QTD1_9EUKA|nr:Hypothetical protein HINF_LOCUS51328 [Hexamita inflata]